MDFVYISISTFSKQGARNSSVEWSFDTLSGISMEKSDNTFQYQR
jgi:hypothetical protein